MSDLKKLAYNLTKKTMNRNIDNLNWVILSDLDIIFDKYGLVCKIPAFHTFLCALIEKNLSLPSDPVLVVFI